jgi:hypothetical protein
MRYLHLFLLPVALVLPALAVGQSSFVDKGVNAIGIMGSLGTTAGENSSENESVAGVTLGFTLKGIIDVGASIGWLLESRAQTKYGPGAYAAVYPVRQRRMGPPFSAAVGMSGSSYAGYKEYSFNFLLCRDLQVAKSSFFQPTIGGSLVDLALEDMRIRYHIGLFLYCAGHPNATTVISLSASFSQEIAPIYSFGFGLVIGKSKMQVN